MILDVQVVAAEGDTHSATQSDTSSQLFALGIRKKKWISGQGIRIHNWRVVVPDGETELMLRLKYTVNTDYRDDLIKRIAEQQAIIDEANKKIKLFKQLLNGAQVY